MSDLPTGGSIRPITRWGEPVMHRPGRPITEFDSEVEQLVADMFVTMDAADGVGLAANQVGIDLRLFVFRCPDEDGVVHEGVVCNPSLELPDGRDRHLDDSEEGCLSLPGAYVACARPDFARVRGVDHLGKPVEYAGDGLLARCLQHETDHTVGMVFGDRLSNRARKKLYAEAERRSPDYPSDWPVTGRVPG